MVQRRAIGATLAATLIFSTLILANLSLFAAATQRERLSLTVNSESLLSDTETVLGGTEGLRLLERLQSLLSTGPFRCSGAAQDLNGFTSSLSDTADQNGTYVEASLTPGDGLYEPDNFSILSPFNGSYPGAVDVDLTLRWSGMSPLKDVSYSGVQTHHLHLPVPLGPMITFCDVSAGRVGSLIEGETFASCEPSAIGPPLGALEDELQSQASARGLAFSLAYSVDNSHGCSVSFTCVVELLGAMGPDGAFNIRLERDETMLVHAEG